MLESFLVYKYGFPSKVRAMLAAHAAFPLTRGKTARQPPSPVEAEACMPHRHRAQHAPILCRRHRSDHARAAQPSARAFA
jgi:hypothetical protein